MVKASNWKKIVTSSNSIVRIIFISPNREIKIEGFSKSLGYEGFRIAIYLHDDFLYTTSVESEFNEATLLSSAEKFLEEQIEASRAHISICYDILTSLKA